MQRGISLIGLFCLAWAGTATGGAPPNAPTIQSVVLVNTTMTIAVVNFPTGPLTVSFNGTTLSSSYNQASQTITATLPTQPAGGTYHLAIYNKAGSDISDADVAIGVESALPNNNTAEGSQALLANTTGSANTANGASALLANTTGSYNTANGAFALGSNTTGSGNTAHGYDALYFNTTGNENTANGVAALFANTTGIDNTANGAFALEFNTTGGANTANGFKALVSNTTGNGNTANGADALFANTTGNGNTANGDGALVSNTTGSGNTANGENALAANTTGDDNTANGLDALANNTTGSLNTANGPSALYANTTGGVNTANGAFALAFNTSGSGNTAHGLSALYANTTGDNNTADGAGALEFNTTGSGNIALGANAGGNLTTGDNNIDIGNSAAPGEATTIRIGAVQTATYVAGISGATVAGGVAVIVDGNGHLGTIVSSRRFKDEIQPMDKASEAILALQPVTFRYKHELDPQGIPQFGLVAEDVEKLNPDLVARDAQGKVYTVRYEAVNAMLLNEFLKEHRRVHELEATVALQQRGMEALIVGLKEQEAQIQKVSARLEETKPAAQVDDNNP